MSTYYKHKINRKDEFIGVLEKYLSPKCIEEIAYLSKRPHKIGNNHILLFGVLDMSYEGEILSFSESIKQAVREVASSEEPVMQVVVFMYEPAYKENKQEDLVRKKSKLRRWLENPEDFVETYEPRDEISDEVLVEKGNRGIQHIVIKYGQFLNVLYESTTYCTVVCFQ